MAKTFTKISESKKISAQVGDKTTIVNTSAANIFLTDDAVEAALSGLEYQDKMAVCNSLYSIAPGSSKSVVAGTYNLTLGFGQSAVLLSENNN